MKLDLSLAFRYALLVILSGTNYQINRFYLK